MRVEILSLCLFDDALSSKYRIALEGGIAVTWQGCGRKQSPLIFHIIMGSALRKLGKTMEILYLGIQSSGQVSPLGSKFEDFELHGRIIKTGLKKFLHATQSTTPAFICSLL